ncbi:MAG TPA: hypothetical protein QF720_00455 [Nitrospinota bacterium]|nr:hypothetical protein [Nitrospinota bacterium]|tara:strand:+ start:892 stop:1086 length:195 start_codon:yes stop_codon:yes gene_type:complete
MSGNLIKLTIKVVVVVISLVALYFIFSPYQKCLRNATSHLGTAVDKNAKIKAAKEFYCAEKTSW